jgi:hypothetical protein
MSAKSVWRTKQVDVRLQYSMQVEGEEPYEEHFTCSISPDRRLNLAPGSGWPGTVLLALCKLPSGAFALFRNAQELRFSFDDDPSVERLQGTLTIQYTNVNMQKLDAAGNPVEQVSSVSYPLRRDIVSDMLPQNVQWILAITHDTDAQNQKFFSIAKIDPIGSGGASKCASLGCFDAMLTDAALRKCSAENCLTTYI